MFRNLKFALNSAWQSFWRNLAVSLAAVVSITLILILAGVNLLVGHAFSQVLDGFKDKVSEMSINVADDTPLQTVYAFRDQLAADPRVASVKFVTKAEALAQFEQDPNNYALAQQLAGNVRAATVATKRLALRSFDLSLARFLAEYVRAQRACWNDNETQATLARYRAGRWGKSPSRG